MMRCRFVPGSGCITGAPWIGTSTVGVGVIDSAGGLFCSGALATLGPLVMFGTAASKRSSATLIDLPREREAISLISEFCFAGFSGSEIPVTVICESVTMRLSLFTSVAAVNDIVPKFCVFPPVCAMLIGQVPVTVVPLQDCMAGGYIVISSVPAVKMRGHDPSTVSGAGVGAVGVMTPSDCVAVKADEPLLGTHAPSDVRTMRESTMFMECTSARIGVVPEEVQQKCEGQSVSNFTGSCDWMNRE